MTSLEYKIISFVVLVFATILNAIPNDPKTTVAPEAEGGTNNSHVLSDQEPLEESEVDQAIGQEVKELTQKICEILLGQCWVFYERTKPHLEAGDRESICLKRLRGFASCRYLTEEEMKKAKEDIENKKKEDAEKAAEDAKTEEERKKSLNKLNEEWNLIRMKGCGEIVENFTSTTPEPDMFETTEMMDMTSSSSPGSIEIDF